MRTKIEDQKFIQGVLDGLSCKEIGKRYGTTECVVKKRLSKIYRTQHVSCRFELLRKLLPSISPLSLRKNMQAFCFKDWVLNRLEYCIIHGVLEGLSDEEIGEPFGLGHHAIKKRLTTILRETGLPSRAELIRFVHVCNLYEKIAFKANNKKSRSDILSNSIQI